MYECVLDLQRFIDFQLTMLTVRANVPFTCVTLPQVITTRSCIWNLLVCTPFMNSAHLFESVFLTIYIPIGNSPSVVDVHISFYLYQHCLKSSSKCLKKYKTTDISIHIKQ